MFICDISVFNKYGKQRLDEMLSSLQIDWRGLVIMLVLEQVPGISQTRLSPFLQTDKANLTLPRLKPVGFLLPKAKCISAIADVQGQAVPSALIGQSI